MVMISRGALVCTVGVVVGGAQAATFQGLGDLAGGSISSTAFGISADGLVVVGQSTSASGAEAFRWDAVNGIVGLGDIAGGSFSSVAKGVSADGSVVVGTGRSGSGAEAFRWDPVNGMVSIGASLFPDYAYGSNAQGVSADGSVIVGARQDDGPISEAYRWDAVNGFVGLADYSGGEFFSEARSISGDGAVCAGYGWPNASSSQECAVWMGTDPPFDAAPVVNQSDATAVSQDGTVVVGWYDYFDIVFSINRRRAFRWMQGGGSVELAALGGTDLCYAQAVNADGSVIVGYSTTASSQAVIWRNGVAIESLTTVLTSEYGIDLTGWTLRQATGVSADGLVIVGWGTNPSGKTEGWIADLRVPAPTCAGDITGDGITNAADFTVLAGNFGNAVTPNTGGDLNGDGLVNAADFTILAGDFGCGAE